MKLLADLVNSGRIADIALAVMLVELVVLVLIARRRNHPIDVPGLFFNMGAGGSLVLALRASLTAAGWPWVAAFLLLSLAFHASDVGRRWRKAGEQDRA